MQHKIWKLILGGRLRLAPIDDPDPRRPSEPQALDVGTGFGSWALDFGEMGALTLYQEINQCRS